MFQVIKQSFFKWLTHEPPPTGFPLCDFERIRYEVRPCDVLLIEGRSRISNVIKQITQSSWSHSCIYIGRIHDIEDEALRNKLTEHFSGSFNEPLVIEGYLGQGTIVSPLEMYRSDHIRICRPRGLSRTDANSVIHFSIDQLGKEYDVRQIIDLARFLIPWSVIPGSWRSSLFAKSAGESTKTVCSTMIAEAFASVEFPILPMIKQHEETGIELIPRNPKLFTPRDFDYSPFFEIIKYPFIELSELSTYRNLPWNRSGLMASDGQPTVVSAKVESSDDAFKQEAADNSSYQDTVNGPDSAPEQDMPNSAENSPPKQSKEESNDDDSLKNVQDDPQGKTSKSVPVISLPQENKGIFSRITPNFSQKANKKLS